MKNVRKVLVLVLALMFILPLLPLRAEEPSVRITLMQSKTEIQSDFEEVIAAFHEEHPEIEVELLGTSGDNFATVLQSNFSSDPAEAPTIFTISGVDTEMFESFFAPLDDTEAAALLPDNLKNYVTLDDQLVGLPLGVEGYGFIYNVDMFDEAGVDPESLTDIDSFVEALATLAEVEGVEAPIGFAMENYFSFVHFFNWGPALTENYAEELQKVVDEEQTLADIPAVQAWADALAEIAPYTNKALVSYDDQIAGFGVGQYAMIHQGVWAQQVLDQNEVDFAYDFLAYPLEGNDKMPVGPATAWRVNNAATEEQQDAAKLFLDWLITSDTGQELSADLLNTIPAYRDVKAPEGHLTEAVARFVSEGATIDWVFNTDFPAGIDVGGAEAMQKFYADRIDSNELLDELTIAWQRD